MVIFATQPYEVLDVVENRQKQALLDDGGSSSQ